jgi:type I restriction enzyme R subunit
LQRALAIYGSASGGGVQEGEQPVKDKQTLLKALADAIGEATGFCQDQGVDLAPILTATSVSQRIALEEDALNALLVNDEAKQTFLTLVTNVDRIYRAILPDPLASQYQPLRSLLVVLVEKIRSLAPEVDIAGVMGEVETLLDRSIAPQGYVIRPGIAETRAEYTTDSAPHLVDLSQIDLEALQAHFKHSQQRIEIEKLRGAINRKLQHMVRLNRQRMDYMQQFQQMIEEYNAGSRNAELFFSELIEFTRRLTGEEQRHNEEELALFDLLVGKPLLALTAKERKQVKAAARKLLEVLKAEKLTLDWRKRQQARAAVKVAIEEILDQQLPDAYTPEVYQQKCEAVYQHIYEGILMQAGVSIQCRWRCEVMSVTDETCA